jgi:hypothetical protein
MFTRVRRWLSDKIAPKHPQQYIGRELSHFVGRSQSPEAQYVLLVEILRTGCLLASPPQGKNITGHISFNTGKSFSLGELLVPQMLCFCDIPTRELGIHCRKYSPFGLAFSKRFLADRGARPVIYVPGDGRSTARSSGPRLAGLEYAGKYGADALGNLAPTGRYFDELVPLLRGAVESADASPGVGPLVSFLNRDILSFYKFFDVAQADEHPDNYYFEREWRVLGNVQFASQDVVRVFMPPSYVDRFRKECEALAGVACALEAVAV